MDMIFADLSVSMTEFKKNPAEVLRSADDKPVAVLSHNKPAFYMLTPKLLEDKELTDLARQRLATTGDIVMVDIDQI